MNLYNLPIELAYNQSRVDLLTANALTDWISMSAVGLLVTRHTGTQNSLFKQHWISF